MSNGDLAIDAKSSHHSPQADCSLPIRERVRPQPDHAVLIADLHKGGVRALRGPATAVRYVAASSARLTVDLALRKLRRTAHAIDKRARTLAVAAEPFPLPLS